MKKFVFWSLFLVLPSAFFSVLYALDSATPLDQKYQINEVEYLVSTSQSPPHDSANWQAIKLPFELDSSTGLKPSVWFRLRLYQNDHRLQGGYKEQPSLLFLAPYSNLAIYLDDFLVAQEGSMAPPTAYHRRSLLFGLPPDVVAREDVTLLVHMVKPRPGGSFKPFYLAPESIVKPQYNNDIFLKLRLPQAIMVTMAFITAIMILLFALRRSETTFGWYALMLLFWLLHHSHDLVVDIPIENYWLWVAFSYTSLGWFVVFGALFVNKFLGFHHPRTEKAIFTIAVIGSLNLMFLAVSKGHAVITFGQTLWVPSINLLGICVVIQLYRGVRKNPSLDNQGLLLVTYMVTVVGVRDYIFEVTTGWVPGTVYYLQYSSGLVLVGFSLWLMSRFAFALQEAESLNQDLEQRIAEKAQELESNFLSLKNAERATTVAAERERIMRDMHDGFGGQLIQLLSMVENTPELAPIEPAIREALHDLRLIIDSISETDGNLLIVLGAFRHRTNNPIKKSGITLEWKVADFVETPHLSPSMTLQVLRILQEAVTNIIKHAKASQLSISTTQPAPNTVNICIKDNGQGYSLTQTKAGHGLLNMHHRAKRLDGELVIVTDDSGTQIDLKIPCP